MGKNSSIEWTDHTFNPWLGCSKISPGCEHCYAESWAKRAGFPGLWNDGERRRTSTENWRKPFRWNAEAEFSRERRRVFCASLADVFDNVAPDEWRAYLFRLIRETSHLDWLLLTKRIGNAKVMLPPDWGDGYPNVWLGATVVNQEEADRDIPKLLAVPARVRFLSCEPMLGAINLRSLYYDSGERLPEEMRVNSEKCLLDALAGITTWPTCHYQSPTIKREARIIGGTLFESDGERRSIDWVICGGESGPGARPMHPAWVRSLRDQCMAARVPYFFKQWGMWIPEAPAAGGDLGGDVRAGRVTIVQGDAREPDGHFRRGDAWMRRVDKRLAGRLLDGREWNEFPEVNHGN